MTNFRMQFAVALTSTLLTAAPPLLAADDAAELEAVRSKVSGLFAEIGPGDVFKSPVEGWYTVRKGAVVAYISADGRYLLQGDIIDLDEQVNITENSRNEARAVMMAAVSSEEMIVFSPDEVKHSVAVFTDIDCTYCRRLHAQIDDYMAQGIEIRYLLYPRSGPESASWSKAEEVWCAHDRNDALTLAKLDKSFESSTCNSAIISTHYKMGQDVGLRGTPAIVLEDGTLVSGYLPPLRLSEALASARP